MTSVSSGRAQRKSRPVAEATVSNSHRRFEVVSGLKDARSVVAGATTTAVRAVRDLRVGAPRREVAVVFDTLGQRFKGDDVAEIARYAQVHTKLGAYAFPAMLLDETPKRIGDCASWAIAAEPEERGFAIDKDGSLACVERIREASTYATRYGVSGLGIVACLRPVVGAMLFARALASRQRNLTHAWIILRLELVPDMHLVIDMTGQPLRDPTVDKLVAKECEIVEGGWFDPHMDNESVESFVLKIIARLGYRFGLENRRQVVQDEIQRLFGLYRHQPSQ